MFSFHIPFRAAFRHPFHCLYRIPALLILLALSFSLTGCHKNELPAKEKELDFTVVAGTDIPVRLTQMQKSLPYHLICLFCPAIVGHRTYQSDQRTYYFISCHQNILLSDHIFSTAALSHIMDKPNHELSKLRTHHINAFAHRTSDS